MAEEAWIKTMPNPARYEETVAAERRLSPDGSLEFFPELKNRFNPGADPEAQERLRKKVMESIEFQELPPDDREDFMTRGMTYTPMTIAVTGIVMETAALMETCLHGHDIRNKTALFVIGATGSGKSSLCNWLVGHKLSAVDVKADEAGDDDDFGAQTVKELKIEFVGGGPQFAVSGENESKTFVPTLYELPGQNRVLIDFPGFFDTSAFDVRLGMDLGFRKVLNAFEGRARIIALVAVQNFDPAAARGGPGKEQLKKMQRLVPTSSTPVPPVPGRSPGAGSRFCVCVTRCDADFAPNAANLWKNMKESVGALDTVMAGSIWNANKHMLKIGKEPWHTPPKFMADLDSEYPIERNLQSDCLDVKDADQLEKILKSNDFTGHLLAKIMSRLDGGGADIGGEASRLMAQAAIMGDHDKIQLGDGEGAGRLIEKAAKMGAKVTLFSNWLLESSDKLVEQKTLALGDVDERIRWLELQDQPRLTRALARVEQSIMKQVVARAAEMHEDLKKDTRKLVERGLIIGDDAVRVEHAIKVAEGALQEMAKAKGYESTRDMTKEILAGGVCVVAAAGGGVTAIVVGVSATAYAVAGLCTGGVSCLIVGAIGAGVAWKYKEAEDAKEAQAKKVASEKKFSNDLACIQMDAFRDHVNAARAATAHDTKLTAIIDKKTELSW